MTKQLMNAMFTLDGVALTARSTIEAYGVAKESDKMLSYCIDYCYEDGYTPVNPEDVIYALDRYIKLSERMIYQDADLVDRIQAAVEVTALLSGLLDILLYVANDCTSNVTTLMLTRIFIQQISEIRTIFHEFCQMARDVLEELGYAE